METFNYTFAALRGIQAGKEYFVAMCPLRLIPKIFLFDERELPPELREQRVLNKARIPAIARYIVQNPKDYIFSAITASIDGEVDFQPIVDRDGRSLNNIGHITIPMSARFVVNDGQHRRAAIDEALKERPELKDETLAVVFFIDAGLKRSQQNFADLNTHAVRPSASIGILYDHRDPLASLARKLSLEIAPFKGLTELERTTIPNRSIKLFTLSGIYYATGALLNKKQGDKISSDDQKIAMSFWTEMNKIIPQWQSCVNRLVSSAELRRDFIHTHSVTLHAMGIAGAALIAQHPDDWQIYLKKLETTDWSRTNSFWEGRAMIGGQMSKARTNVVRTSSAIKQMIGLPLSEEEQHLEQYPEAQIDESELEETEA